ncbi:MAG: hypothetical protein D6812_02875 [Deltaproteobacteria bacterium]|nr:MAG: hypothetical protein D6812_02875 [Deltaproteobacteria bacterium]
MPSSSSTATCPIASPPTPSSPSSGASPPAPSIPPTCSLGCEKPTSSTSPVSPGCGRASSMAHPPPSLRSPPSSSCRSCWTATPTSASTTISLIAPRPSTPSVDWASPSRHSPTSRTTPRVTTPMNSKKKSPNSSASSSPSSLPLLPQQRDCQRCELHTAARNPGVPTIQWSSTADPSLPALLIIGQNPGYQEDQRAEPFIGPSGQILRRAYIATTDLPNLATIYLTNAVRCHTTANALPKTSHLKACLPYLHHDVVALHHRHPHHPVYLLAVGALAVRAVHPRTNALKESFSHQNLVVHIEGVECRVFSTYHPAATIRQPNFLLSVRDHITLLENALNGTLPVVSAPTIQPPAPPPSGDLPRH